MKRKNLAWIITALLLTMFFASCKNASVDDYIPVSDIALEYGWIELAAGEEKTLTATINPNNATDKAIVWESSNKNIAVVTSQDALAATIKVLDNARTGETVTITATAKNTRNINASCTIAVKSAGGNVDSPIQKINGTYIFDGTTLIIEDGVVRDKGGIPIGSVQINSDGQVTIIVKDNHGNEITYTAQTNSEGSLDINSVTRPDGTEIIVEEHTHTWDEGVVTKEATENEYGEKTFTCTKCGLTKTEIFGGAIPEPKIFTLSEEEKKNISGKYIIPDGFTEIGNSAFEDCTGLTSVVIPASMTKIGASAFYNCTGLESVKIPDSVTEICDDAFCGCENLKSITFSEESQLTKIGDFAFTHCTSLTSITIPDGVTTLTSAFINCTNLASITIPSSVMNIDWAFASCTNLKSVIFEQGSKLTAIGEYTFHGCKKLDSIDIPNGVKKIQYKAFDGCTSLTNIKIPESITEIEERVFKDCTNLTEITIPNGVTEIGWSAFVACTSLDRINYMGTMAQWNAITIRNEAIPSDTTVKYTDVFTISKEEKKNISGEYIIPDGFTAIGENAFHIGCEKNLTSVKIPASITRIGYRAFSECENLKSVIFSEGSQLTKIEDEVFYFCTSLTEITIPNGITEIGDYAFYGTSITNITIPDGVTEICDDAFCGCENLKSITFSEGSQLTKIGDYAFASCKSLTNIKIPDSVTEIGWNAFNRCTSFAYGSIDIPNSVKKLNGMKVLMNGTSIEIVDDIKEFSGFFSLTVWFIEGIGTIDTVPQLYNIKHITLPNGVTEIKESAFMVSKLVSITLPDSLTKIDDYAFYGCNNLVINYTGSQTQWNAIEKGSGAIPSSVKINYNYPKTN